MAAGTLVKMRTHLAVWGHRFIAARKRRHQHDREFTASSTNTAGLTTCRLSILKTGSFGSTKGSISARTKESFHLERYVP